jgi:hypothetical protein
MRQLKHPRVIESARHLEHYLREYSTALTEVSQRAAQSPLLWRQLADDRREFYDDSEYLSARLRVIAAEVGALVAPRAGARRRVLLVTHRAEQAAALQARLGERCELVGAGRAREALELLAAVDCDVVVASADLAGEMSGAELLAFVAGGWPHVRRVLCAAGGTGADEAAAAVGEALGGAGAPVDR